MKYFFSLFSFLFLFGCISENDKPDNDTFKIVEDSVKTEPDIPVITIDTSENADQSDTVLFYNTKEINALKLYFSDSAIAALNHIQLSLNQAKTDSDLLSAYKKLLAIRKVLTSEIWKKNLPDQKEYGYYPDYIISDLYNVSLSSIGLRATCVAECTEFDFTFLLTDFIDLAQKTSGELDDEFFELLSIANSEYGGTGEGWFDWFYRTWDYGGGSMLGSGIHLKFLQKEVAFREKTHQFDSLLDKYHSDLIRDLGHGIYMQTADKVVEELNAIIQLPSLSEQGKEAAESLLYKISSGNISCKNCVEGHYQFGCDTADCNWGG